MLRRHCASRSKSTRALQAEQAAVDLGVSKVTVPPSYEERFLLGAADAWRNAVRNDLFGRGGDGVMTPRSRGLPSAVRHYLGALFAAGGAAVAIGDAANNVTTNPIWQWLTTPLWQ